MRWSSSSPRRYRGHVSRRQPACPRRECRSRPLVPVIESPTTIMSIRAARTVRGRDFRGDVMAAFINPLPKWALKGRIVTMAAKGDVVADGTIYIDNDRIAAIVPAGKPAPAGFDNVPTIDSKGTVYPGLIELHNHL